MADENLPSSPRANCLTRHWAKNPGENGNPVSAPVPVMNLKGKLMNQLAKLNLLLDAVGRRDAIHGLKLAIDGTGGMELNNGTRVYFEYMEGEAKLCIYSPLMKIPSDEKERLSLLRTMLEGNFLGIGNGALAIAPRINHAVYQIVCDVPALDVQRLDEAIDTVLKWREVLLQQLEKKGGKQMGPSNVFSTAVAARQRFITQNRNMRNG